MKFKTLFVIAASALILSPSIALAATAPVESRQELKADVQAVSSEVVKSIGVGAKQVFDTSISGVNKLTSEAINLFIFQGLIHILYYSVIFIVFYVVKRYIDFLQEAGMDVKKSKALKTSALIISLAFFSTQTMPHMMSITEALVAPNVFIMKKGAEFVKDFQGK